MEWSSSSTPGGSLAGLLAPGQEALAAAPEPPPHARGTGSRFQSHRRRERPAIAGVRWLALHHRPARYPDLPQNYRFRGATWEAARARRRRAHACAFRVDSACPASCVSARTPHASVTRYSASISAPTSRVCVATPIRWRGRSPPPSRVAAMPCSRSRIHARIRSASPFAREPDQEAARRPPPPPSSCAGGRRSPWPSAACSRTPRTLPGSLRPG